MNGLILPIKGFTYRRSVRRTDFIRGKHLLFVKHLFFGTVPEQNRNSSGAGLGECPGNVLDRWSVCLAYLGPLRRACRCEKDLEGLVGSTWTSSSEHRDTHTVDTPHGNDAL